MTERGRQGAGGAVLEHAPLGTRRAARRSPAPAAAAAMSGPRA